MSTFRSRPQLPIPASKSQQDICVPEYGDAGVNDSDADDDHSTRVRQETRKQDGTNSHSSRSSNSSDNRMLPQHTQLDEYGFEQATTKTVTLQDLAEAEQAVGLEANVFTSSTAQAQRQLRPGSLKQPQWDVHGIHRAFEEGGASLDASRPPFGKKLPPQVLQQMVSWEKRKQAQFKELREDPMYQFLAAMATTARLDVQQLLQNNNTAAFSGLSVGSDLLLHRQEAELTETPAQSVQPAQRRAPAADRQRGGSSSDGDEQEHQQEHKSQPAPGESHQEQEPSVGFLPSSARESRRKERRKRKRRGRTSSQQQQQQYVARQDLSRSERRMAYNAQSWLRRVEVIGRFSISDRAVTSINQNYSRVVLNAPALNGVHVRHFMLDEHISSRFALLCGTYLNYLDFTSRRTYSEISMNNIYIKSMNDAVSFFKTSVVWSTQAKKLVVIAAPARGSSRLHNSQMIPYQRVESDGYVSQVALVSSPYSPTLSAVRLYP